MVPAENSARGVLQAIRAPVTVGIWNSINFRRERLETRLVGVRLAGQGHGQQSPAVKGVFEADDGRPASEGARNLNGILDRFRAAVDQQGLFGKVARCQRI